MKKGEGVKVRRNFFFEMISPLRSPEAGKLRSGRNDGRAVWKT
jgi:hypothetical protein